MALVNCQRCARQISTTAVRCPGCGAPGPAAGAVSGPPTRASGTAPEIVGQHIAESPDPSRGRMNPRLRTGLVVSFVVAALIVLRWVNGSGYSAERYFPLKQGLTWKYRMSATIHSFPVSGEAAVTNLAPRSLEGATVVPQTSDMTFGSILGIALPKSMVAAFYANDQTGIREIANQESTDVEPKPLLSYILKYPIEVGTQWTDRVKTSLIKRGTSISLENSVMSTTDQVIVPAGAYQNCVRVKSSGKTGFDSSGAFISVEQNAWFARDVGQIKQIYSESGGDSSDKQTFVIELEEFKR